MCLVSCTRTCCSGLSCKPCLDLAKLARPATRFIHPLPLKQHRRRLCFATSLCLDPLQPLPVASSRALAGRHQWRWLAWIGETKKPSNRSLQKSYWLLTVARPGRLKKAWRFTCPRALLLLAGGRWTARIGRWWRAHGGSPERRSFGCVGRELGGCRPAVLACWVLGCWLGGAPAESLPGRSQLWARL